MNLELLSRLRAIFVKIKLKGGTIGHQDGHTAVSCTKLVDCGKSSIFMLAVHSRRRNLRQGESENVDGNTRLALNPLV